MKSPPKNVSEDDGLTLTITRRNTRSKTSINGIDNSEPIPIDLIIEIFLRLTTKSIGTCRCVSKLWASILRRPDFTELFFTRSLARPQLLFVCENFHDGKLVFFSAPQPQNPNDNSFSVAASYPKKVTRGGARASISHVNGLVLDSDRILEGTKDTMLVSLSIWNPSTRQLLTSPTIKTNKTKNGIRSFFGYDTIGKQYKVLSMISLVAKGVYEEHQVLTLGTEIPSWRMIECCIPPHYSSQKGICINGVLYYRASFNSSPRIYMIVCFDVRSEKFKSFNLSGGLSRTVGYGTLINYKGKLGSLGDDRYIDCTYRSINLWVLKDAEKEEWLEHTYVLSALCKDIVGKADLQCVGVTRTNEIVLSRYGQTVPFDVLY